VAEPPSGGPRGRLQASAAERWQEAVARRSAESRATIPDLELEVEADADALAGWARGEPRRLTAALVRACALALREHPLANGAYRDGGFERYERVNVGVIVAAPGAYAIPTVFDADAKAPDELAAELAALERAALAGALRAPQLSGATFTLWDLGPLGVERGVPLVVPGQAAALAAGRVRERALVRGGRVLGAHAITLTLAADHRILYGAAAADFLTGVKRRLEHETSG
jgi:pyruvate dehydrogenase E2 component (dihydrolipoamide acetyltransferase)